MTLTVRGTVVAAADGNGFAAGETVPDATVSLYYVTPLSLSNQFRGSDVTDAAGTWEVYTGPPPGQSEPTCATLSIHVTRVGFLPGRLSLGEVDGCQGSGVLEGVVIELDPGT